MKKPQISTKIARIDNNSSEEEEKFAGEVETGEKLDAAEFFFSKPLNAEAAVVGCISVFIVVY